MKAEGCSEILEPHPLPCFHPLPILQLNGQERSIDSCGATIPRETQIQTSGLPSKKPTGFSWSGASIEREANTANPLKCTQRFTLSSSRSYPSQSPEPNEE